MDKIRLKAIQRIYKDLQEIEENPIDGLSIVMPNENNPFELRSNILILDGIYKNLLLHLIVHLPERYPLDAPKMIIASGQTFNNTFHHHVFPVFGDIKNGYTICIDLLDHGFFAQGEKTGWTPAYTLSTVLMQMQIFFANDYDLGIHIPSKKQIANLKDTSKMYKTIIKLTNGKEVTHSYEQPYPPIVHQQVMPKKEDDKEVIKRKKAYERLTCYLTRNTPKESEFPMGYPMQLSRDDKDRIHIVPILEILSYEGYITQMASTPAKVFDTKKFGSYKLRTAMGADYNYWFPLYINEQTFTNNKQNILNAVSVLKFGIEGLKKFDFTPDMVLSIFPCLMNKMIVALQEGALFQSYAAIEAYCHFMRLFARLLQEFPQLQDAIDQKVEKVLLDNQERNKSNLGDMGEFLITLAFSKLSFHNKDLWKELIKEYISRQFLWVILKVDAREKSMKNPKSNGFQVHRFEESNVFLKESKEIQYSNLLFFYQMTGKELQEFYRASKISNNLLLFNFIAATRFLLDKKDFIKRVDENYGVIEEKEVEEFLKEVKKIKSSINNYQDLFTTIGLGDIYNDYFSVLGLFRIALKNSYVQGYNSFKLSKMTTNFIQKSDYLSLLVRWFMEANVDNKKLVDFLIKPEQNALLIDLAMKENNDIFSGDFPFPMEFAENLRNRRSFEIEVLNRRFFYFWLLLLSKNLQKVPKKLLLEMFTLSPKENKEKRFKDEKKKENIEDIENFKEVHIENIFKAFSIVFNMTLNKLFEKFKVLTLQSLCFLIRVFLLAKEVIPELNVFFEKTIIQAFSRKDEINYGSLINLAIFVRISGGKDYDSRIQLILKHTLSRNIAKLIRLEQNKQNKRKNIIEILAFLFKEQFEISKNEEFQKVLFIQNIFSNILQNFNEFIINMDNSYFVLNDDKVSEMKTFHKKVKGNCDRIEKLKGFFNAEVNSEDFLFSALEKSLEKTTFFTNINKNLDNLLQNRKSCLFFAKIYWKTDIFEDLKVKGFEEGLVKNLIGMLTGSFFRLFSGFIKKDEDKKIEIENMDDAFKMVKANIEKYNKKYLDICAEFVGDECVDTCSEEDFYRFFVIAGFLKKKQYILTCFGEEIFRKYLRWIIGRIWEEKFMENGENYQRFFDFYWLKQMIFDNDFISKKKHRFLIFLIQLEDDGKEGFGEKIEKFQEIEKGMFLTHVYEKMAGNKKGKMENIAKMIKEIQEDIKDKFKTFLNV